MKQLQKILGAVNLRQKPRQNETYSYHLNRCSARFLVSEILLGVNVMTEKG